MKKIALLFFMLSFISPSQSTPKKPAKEQKQKNTPQSNSCLNYASFFAAFINYFGADIALAIHRPPKSLNNN